MGTPLVSESTFLALVQVRQGLGKHGASLINLLEQHESEDLCRALVAGYRAYDATELTPDQEKELQTARVELEKAAKARDAFVKTPVFTLAQSHAAFKGAETWDLGRIQATYETILASLVSQVTVYTDKIHDLENCRLVAAVGAVYAILGGKPRSSGPGGARGNDLDMGVWRMPFGQESRTYYGLIDAHDKWEIWHRAQGKPEKAVSWEDLPVTARFSITSPSELRRVCHLFVRGPTRGQYFGTKGLDAIRLYGEKTVTADDVGSGGTGRKGSYCHLLTGTTAAFRKGEKPGSRVTMPDDTAGAQPGAQPDDTAGAQPDAQAKGETS